MKVDGYMTYRHGPRVELSGHWRPRPIIRGTPRGEIHLGMVPPENRLAGSYGYIHSTCELFEVVVRHGRHTLVKWIARKAEVPVRGKLAVTRLLKAKDST